jgi:hypothetical protein
VNRLRECSEVAEAVVCALSDGAAFVTGDDLVVDGRIFRRAAGSIDGHGLGPAHLLVDLGGRCVNRLPLLQALQGQAAA